MIFLFWRSLISIFLQRPRYSREEVPSDRMGIDKRQDATREETPEEGEI